MSNKTQLQTNNTALDSLITRVNTAKDVAASLPEAGSSGGSGGGSAIETCTVTIDNEEIFCNWHFFYSCLTDGKVELVETELDFGSKILENVIKNSYVTVEIDSTDGIIDKSTFSGGVSAVHTFLPLGSMGECMSVWQVISDGTVVPKDS